MKDEEQKSLKWLGNILDILLKDCPWDSRQTFDSLRYLTIEETYELSETILTKNYDEMRGELGDLLMHILFYCKLAEKEGKFTLKEVIDGICQKLIGRHPHISLPNRDGKPLPALQEQQPRWEQVKMKEGRKSTLEGVPNTLPSLVKSVRLQEKAAGAGFSFQKEQESFNKVKEEYFELTQAFTGNGNVEEEFGDLLFALVGWGRFHGVNADDALSHANEKFKQRFTIMEQYVAKNGKTLSNCTSDELTSFWKEAKLHKQANINL
ncbi:MAG: nucleoside triphosphate pyrophosphohydrolase [Bacteroidales bacterium]|nr:nucleoside triphosphate pyrophosphohydrolase [Bacteroidales bacterium]